MTECRSARRLPDYATFARLRIVGWVMLLTTAGLAAAGTAVVVVESDRIDRRADANIAQEFGEARRTADDPRDPFESPEELLVRVLDRNEPQRHEVYLALIEGEPRFVTYGPETGSRTALAEDPAFLAAVREPPDDGFGTVETVEGEVHFGVLPVSQGDAQASYVVAYYTDPWRGQFVEVMGSYAVVALLTLLLIALGAWLVAGRLLRPVHQLETAAREINETDLSQRLQPEQRSELSGLAHTFNSMLDRLEGAFATQRDFLNDAGHELATPITIVRGHLELMDGGDPVEVAETRALLLDELDRMSRLVDDLVTLAKTERPDFVRHRPVDLGELTDELVRLCAGLDDREWQVDARAEAVIDGDPQRLVQAVLQLAANAVRYTAADDDLALGSAVEGGDYLLWVRDTGPGLTPDEAEQVFERFVRGAGARRTEGSGLGLAIVRAIAEGHGGTVTLDSSPGEGARFTLRLPVGRSGTPPAAAPEPPALVAAD